METASRSHHLTRSLDDRVVAGVAGGLGEYLETDPVWMRLGFVVAGLFWGVGLVVYAILWITLPEQGPDPSDLGEGEEQGERPALATQSPRAVAGIALLTLGLLILVWKILALLSYAIVIPVLLVGLGLFLLLHRRS